jgi:hypothetical protein
MYIDRLLQMWLNICTVEMLFTITEYKKFVLGDKWQTGQS